MEYIISEEDIKVEEQDIQMLEEHESGNLIEYKSEQGDLNSFVHTEEQNNTWGFFAPCTSSAANDCNVINQTLYESTTNTKSLNQKICSHCGLSLTAELLPTHMKAHAFVKKQNELPDLLNETIMEFKEKITQKANGILCLKAEEDACWIDLSIFAAELKTPSDFYQYITSNSANIKTMLTQQQIPRNNSFTLIQQHDVPKKFILRLAMNSFAELLSTVKAVLPNASHVTKLEPVAWHSFFNAKLCAINALKCNYNFDLDNFLIKVAEDSLGTLKGCCHCNNKIEIHFSIEPIDIVALDCRICMDEASTDAFTCRICNEDFSAPELLDSHLKMHNENEDKVNESEELDSSTPLAPLLQSEDFNDLILSYKEKITFIEYETLKLKDYQDTIWLEISEAALFKKTALALYVYVFNNVNNIRNLLGINLPEPSNECFESERLKNFALIEETSRFTILVEAKDFQQLLEETTYFEKCNNRNRTVLRMKPGLWQHFLSTKIWEAQRQTCGYNFKRQAISPTGKSGSVMGYCKCGSKLRCFIREFDANLIAYYCETTKGSTGVPCKKTYLRGPIRKHIAAQLSRTSVKEFYAKNANDPIKSFNKNTLHVIKAEFKNRCVHCRQRFQTPKLLALHLKTHTENSNSQDCKSLPKTPQPNNELLNEVILDQFKDKIVNERNGHRKLKSKDDHVWHELSQATGFIKNAAYLYNYVQNNRFGIKDLLGIKCNSPPTNSKLEFEPPNGNFELEFEPLNQEIVPLETPQRGRPKNSDQVFIKTTILQWRDKLVNESEKRIKSERDPVWQQLSEAIHAKKSAAALYEFVTSNKYGIRDSLGLPIETANEQIIDNKEETEKQKSFIILVPTAEYETLLSKTTYGRKKKTVFTPGLWTNFLNKKIWESQHQSCAYYFKRHNLSSNGKSGQAIGYCKCDSKLKCFIREQQDDSTIIEIHCETTKGSPNKKCGKLYLRNPLRAQIGAELQNRSTSEFRCSNPSDFLKADIQATNRTLAVLRSEYKKRKLKADDQVALVDEPAMILSQSFNVAVDNEPYDIDGCSFESTEESLAEDNKANGDITFNSYFTEANQNTNSRAYADILTAPSQPVDEPNIISQYNQVIKSEF